MDFKFGIVLVISAYICTTQALPPCTCTRNYKPICGSDGETYSNQCLLDCVQHSSNKEITALWEGTCEDKPDTSCICTFQYLPVCGNDGVTYPSKCNLDCQRQRNAGLEMSHEGVCRPTPQETPCICTREKKPVCGSDGHTYSNDCLLNCATKDNSMLSIKSFGPCAGDEDRVKVVDIILPQEPPCVCTREKKPVCGSDGRTYNNDCLLNCATKDNSMLSIKSFGPCAEDKVKVVDNIEPQEPPCICTREEKPVCGSDGHTYSNDCLLNCATKNNSMLSIKSFGPCEGNHAEPDLHIFARGDKH